MTRLGIGKVAERLKEKGLQLELTQEAKDYLIEKGTDEKAKEPAKEDAKKDQPKKGSKGELSQLGAGLAPLPQDAIDSLRTRFSVEPFAVDSALLRVSAEAPRAPKRLLLVEFAAIDRFHRALLFPFVLGHARAARGTRSAVVGP